VAGSPPLTTDVGENETMARRRLAVGDSQTLTPPVMRAKSRRQAAARIKSSARLERDSGNTEKKFGPQPRLSGYRPPGVASA
jgi:hypothetical protein